MPTYLFMHPETEETIELVQGMKDKHFYVDENGVEWDRVWVNPNTANSTTEMDPYSEKDFVAKTRGKNYTVGEMWNLSKELHEKRKIKEGRDTIKAKHENERQKAMDKRSENRAKQAASVKKKS